MTPETPPILNYFEREVLQLMRGLDAVEQSTALGMMRRYVELLPALSLPDDEMPERGGEDDE